MADQLDIPAGPSYRMSRPQRMDANTRRLAIIAGGVGGALVVLVGLWSAVGHRPHGVPVIEADSHPMRMKPVNAGGLEFAGQDDAIMSGGDGSKDAMAPPPEAPAPQALKAAEAEARKQAAAMVQPVPPLPAATESPKAQPVVLSPPQPSPAIPPSALAAMPALPARQAPRSAVPAAIAPAARSGAAVPAPVTPAAGSAQVQLAALVSEELAMSEWSRLSRKMPDLLGGRHPSVLKSEHDGKTFFRLRTGGFASAAQAGAFCEQIRLKGNGCTVATF